MIIVSQDKTRLVNFERVEILGINIENTNQIACGFNEGKLLLGEYKTEERAKEVLQEIVDTYVMIGIDIEIYEGTQRQLPIYTMPED